MTWFIAESCHAPPYTEAMFTSRSIKHCRACGAAVSYLTPADDNRDRATCTVCSTIHYENPINVVGTLPFWDDKVLLCRRTIGDVSGRHALRDRQRHRLQFRCAGQIGRAHGRNVERRDDIGGEHAAERIERIDGFDALDAARGGEQDVERFGGSEHWRA
jgi:Nudix N-terminal